LIVVGITGNFGTGKSSLAKLLKERSAIFIDADKIVHNLLKKDSPIYSRILKIFGEKILHPKSKNINRAKLADIVFSSKKARLKLEALIHPLLKERLRLKISSLKNSSFKKKEKIVVILELPLLFEASFRDIVDKVVVVTATKSNVIKRIENKKSYKKVAKMEVERRWKTQLPLLYKYLHADFVINNDLDLKNLKEEGKKLYLRLSQIA
jgi:dephospho-CoA kinase